MKTIADPGICHDILRLVSWLDLFAKLVDKHPQILRLLYTLASPYRIEQHPVRQHLIGMADHKDEQLKLFRRQVNLFAAHAYYPRLRVDRKIAGLQRLSNFFFGCRDAAKIGPYPGQQLIHAEWLGYVIVGTGIKRCDFVPFLFPNGKHDDRHL